MGNIVSSINRTFNSVDATRLINLTMDEADIYILNNHVYSDDIKIDEIREIHDYDELIWNVAEYCPSRLNVEVENGRIVRITHRG